MVSVPSVDNVHVKLEPQVPEDGSLQRRTALSGTIGLLQTTGDEVAYLVDTKGNRITSVNPRENVTVAFGCNSCTGCAAPVQPCDPCQSNPCDCGCGK